MENTKEVLREIIIKLNNNDIVFGEVKLTKLFYLLEIEYYRQKQERLTDLKWIYYKYGPYSFELSNILKKYPFIKDEYSFDIYKTIKKFKADDLSETKIDELVKAIIFKLVKKWGFEDNNELLDYVYFETEPMIIAEKNKELDFSVIKPLELQPYKKVRLDKEIIRQLHKKIEEKKYKISLIKRNIKSNESFKEFYLDLLNTINKNDIKGNCNSIEL